MSFSFNSRIVDLVAPLARRPGRATPAPLRPAAPDRGERRALLLAMAAAPLFALPGPARAENAAVAGLNRWGSGEYRRFGLLVYEATLWAAADPQQAPLALRLDYKRDIAGEAIVAASLREMRRFVADDAMLQSWAAAMRRIFPDVKRGDHILGVQRADESRFYQGDRLLGVIPGREFAAAFFGIWLDARTSAPDLRAALLRPGGS